MPESFTQTTASHRFSLTIDGKRFEFFTRCTGLALSVDLDEFVEGGISDSLVHLPKHIRYAPLVLTRPVTGLTMETCRWVQESVRRPTRRTGRIACLDASGAQVAKWDLLNVMPVAWRGPTLDAEGTQLAMEEIELVHEGFLPIT
ncbi:phage tail protein [Streptomyces sp. H27-C3]|uniref:phage tail protein n=1 Tax=Streptomyces sp. H27-C3 TaxID=3046305 RepID=UPI0024B944D3|nr:phage tail protein [Streptomyces sp. H27-C3]MDJ0466197.1 phage tail protein [Streptomyces sp. H27-C3]